MKMLFALRKKFAALFFLCWAFSGMTYGQLTVNTSATGVLCNGGSTGTATAIPSGGTTPYTYLWSDANTQTTATASGFTAGTYAVTVTDATAATITVSQAVHNRLYLRQPLQIVLMCVSEIAAALPL